MEAKELVTLIVSCCAVLLSAIHVIVSFINHIKKKKEDGKLTMREVFEAFTQSISDLMQFLIGHKKDENVVQSNGQDVMANNKKVTYKGDEEDEG